MYFGDTVATPQPPASKAEPVIKTMAFEVVSIRPSGPDSAMSWQILENGLHMTKIPLGDVILMAYFPAPYFRYREQLKASAPWVLNDSYDIEARVAPIDLPEWQKARAAIKRNNEVLQTMLQFMLADRCKLVVRHVPAEVQGHVMVVGRHGAKLKETPDGEELPKGAALPDGGIAVGAGVGEPVQWTFHHASMEALRSFLAFGVQGPLDNRTGLAGSYDFILSKRLDYAPPEGQSGSSDPQEFWDFGAIGLEVKPAKLPSEIIMIDHIERPSEN